MITRKNSRPLQLKMTKVILWFVILQVEYNQHYVTFSSWLTTTTPKNTLKHFASFQHTHKVCLHCDRRHTLKSVRSWAKRELNEQTEHRQHWQWIGHFFLQCHNKYQFIGTITVIVCAPTILSSSRLSPLYYRFICSLQPRKLKSTKVIKQLLS